jgi:IclR family transcriptional regulator, acetate operon repressor
MELTSTINGAGSLSSCESECAVCGVVIDRRRPDGGSGPLAITNEVETRFHLSNDTAGDFGRTGAMARGAASGRGTAMSGFSASSAERCLAILDALVDVPRGVALSALCAKLELPQSAAHRLLAVLIQRKLAIQDGETGFYRATFQVAALGLRFLAATKINDICQPVIEALAHRSGELVRLAVLDGNSLTWVAKAQGSQSSIKYDPIIGHEVPLHVTAMGKAWLATMPEKDAVKLVSARGFGGPLVGPRAVKSVTALRQEVLLTRDRGFGLVEEEAEPGISAVAVVVRGGESRQSPVVGCLSIGGPSFRLGRDKLTSFVPDMRETAIELMRVWPLRALAAVV